MIAALPICVTSEREEARDRIRPILSGAARMPSYARQLAAEGLDDPVDIACIGDEAEVTGRLSSLAGTGVTELLANVTGTEEEVARTRSFLVQWDGG